MSGAINRSRLTSSQTGALHTFLTFNVLFLRSQVFHRKQHRADAPDKRI